MKPIRARYAKNGDISVDYQVFGEGDVGLVMLPGFIPYRRLFQTLSNLKHK